MKRHFLSTFFLVFSIGLLSSQTWEHILGPEGGEIINFDTDGVTLYALTKAGIYHSEDEGYHWQLLKASLAKTRHLSQMKASNGIFYAFTDDGKLVRSTDEGNSWHTLLQKPFPINHDDEKLQVLFVKDDTVLVGSTFTIYRSVDKGETWQPTVQLTNELNAEFHSIVEFKNELFAAEGRFIHRSSDGGLTWETVLEPSINNYLQLTTTDSFLLALYPFKLVRSTDGLRTLQEFPIDTIGWYASTSRPNWLYGWGNELYYFYKRSGFCPLFFCHSSDGGETWRFKISERTERRLMNVLQDVVLFNQHFVAAGDGIFHSLDSAKTFNVAQEGMPVLNIDKVVRQGKVLVINTWNSTYLSEDEGKTWLENPKPRSDWDCTTHSQMIATDKSLIRFGMLYTAEEIEISNDQGRSWKTIIVDKSRRLTTTKSAVWLAYKEWNNNGQLFKCYLGDMQDGDSSFVYKLLTAEILNSSTRAIWGFESIFAINDYTNYIIFDNEGRYLRTLPPSPCSTLSELLPTFYFDGTTYYDFCGSRTFILQPNATDWQEIYPQDWTTGIPLYHSPMTFIKRHKGVTWVGLEGKGVFYSTSDDGRFYPVQPQIPYPYPTDIAFEDNKLWVSTDGAGVYTMTLPPVDLEAEHKPAFQVFPNPSSGEIQLKSDVFFTDETQLKILDASGRMVGVKMLAPGLSWEIEFPGLPRGIYFLQLRTPVGTVGAKWVVH